MKTASGKTKTEVAATTDVPLLRKRDAKKEEKLHNVDNLKPEEEEAGAVTVSKLHKPLELTFFKVGAMLKNTFLELNLFSLNEKLESFSFYLLGTAGFLVI